MLMVIHVDDIIDTHNCGSKMNASKRKWLYNLAQVNGSFGCKTAFVQTEDEI